MLITRVTADGFRNLKQADVYLSPGVNIIAGHNGQGKTNLIEAICVLASGRSWRTKNDRELITFSEREAYVSVETLRGGVSDRIAAHIRADEKKVISVNGYPVKRLGELLGVLLAVAFSPDDLALVKGGPAERRRFMDVELCQLSMPYYYELKQYYHILRQRNNLLKDLKKDGSLKDTVYVWDEIMARHGTAISGYRTAFLERVNNAAGVIHGEISDKKERLQLVYKPNVGEKDFLPRLKKALDRDIAAGVTSIGVHKDDITFLLNGQDAKAYGSQGQQRLCCLSSKLALITVIREEKHDDPVVLLDDVLSEFDSVRQKFLLRYIKDVQAVITVTGAERVTDARARSAAMYEIDGGVIKQMLNY